ncbi:MAG: RNase adapter RapZ [Bacillota bacterium]|nr:RNase adapter RapZ [Bacillota bacterium]
MSEQNGKDRVKGGGETAVSARPILIITGMSGAGKTHTIATLEDLGYFCVDNLPPQLFGKFIEGVGLNTDKLPKTAIVADIRGGADVFPAVIEALRELKVQGVNYEVVFLEASDEVLVSRYKETRRPHPLAHDGQDVLASIREERRLLTELRGMADIIIDTTELVNQYLTRHLNILFGGAENAGFSVTVTSFGYKYGLPIDADLVVDVRFLPNPYYIPTLKPLTGLDKEVRDFVLRNQITVEFLRYYVRLIRFLLPHYRHEGKKHIAVTIGCTGGRHRSVAIAEALAKRLRHDGYATAVVHRDIERANQKQKEQ